MADNTTLTPGVGGDSVRDLDRLGAGVKTQVVQLDVGGASGNAESLVTFANPHPMQLVSLNYPISTLNSSAAQIAGNGSFVGGIEDIRNLQAAQIGIVCDTAYVVIITQYNDSLGVQSLTPEAFTMPAGQPFKMNVTLPGNYFNVTVVNLSQYTTARFAMSTTFGVMDTLPTSLGRKNEIDALPTVLSNDDANILNDILQALGVLKSSRGTSGEIRITVLGGTVTTVSTVTTVGTVTTVATLSNQTQVGGYNANNQIPALMNHGAILSNIANMIG